MRNKFTEFIKDARRITLTKEEKFGVKRILEAHIESAPVVSRGVMYRSFALRFVPVALALLVVLGGGTAVASESALPGELLYPIKTAVNERVRGALAPNEEARAEYQSTLVAERIEEAQTLMAEGELEVGIKAKVGQSVEKHTDKTLKMIGNLEMAGNTKAADAVGAHLKNILDEHKDVIEEISEDDETVRIHLEEVRNQINAPGEVQGVQKGEAEGLGGGNPEIGTGNDNNKGRQN